MAIKQYKLTKGLGGAANGNTIAIEHTRTRESLIFVAKVRQKVVELFGPGASLDVISTTYGVHIRYEDEKKNRRIAKLLIKAVEIEEELKVTIPERWKKDKAENKPKQKKLSRITFFCKNSFGYNRTVNKYPDSDIFMPSNVTIPRDYIVDHIRMGGSEHVYFLLEKEEKEWLATTYNKEINDAIDLMQTLE